MNEQRNLSNQTDAFNQTDISNKRDISTRTDISTEAGVSAHTNLSDKKHNLTRWTKYLLDFMFYGGMVVTASLPVTVKLIGTYLPQIGEHLLEHYAEVVIIYFVLGIAAVVLIGELRKIFRTVLAEDCFVMANVQSLQKMGNWSFFIALMSTVRCIVYPTIAMVVIVFVFVIAGLFSKVLALVFEQAVRYKEENDLTI